MSSNGNQSIHWDFSMFQFSNIEAVCECWEPFTLGLDTKNRLHEGLRVESIKSVEVRWREKSLWSRIWRVTTYLDLQNWHSEIQEESFGD